MKLVIVESPNKTKKVGQCLGAGFEVAATAGHFRDLPLRELGIELGTFEPTYVVLEDKEALIAKIRSKAAAATEVLLATDADREGEAISWHLAEVLRLTNPKRLRFQEITGPALQKALSQSEFLDRNLADAQQARRVIDRLVGYQVSPLLRTFGSHHSAGRVQSAVLHLVVVREREREAFRSEPYWTLTAAYRNGLRAQHAELNAEGELAPTRFPTAEAAEGVASRARAATHVVTAIETKPVERKPKGPFTTSTLQQTASVILKFKPEKTMQLAQRLFEAGAITYHRSDSVALSDEAVAMARAFLENDYPEALPPVPPRYKSKGNAQEAHEAIRPTSLDAAPEGLSDDEAALYNLVRKRFIACQCRSAVSAQTTITLDSAGISWRARGHVIQFPSWLKYMAEDEDSEYRKEQPEELALPAVNEDEVLELVGVESKGFTTRPPPRFTQAMLIREMDRTGIGRPSTYAPTVALLFARNYLGEEKTAIFPTPRGRLVDEALAKAFPSLVEASYTAEMETRLDDIAAGKRRWRDEVAAWYPSFAAQLASAEAIIADLAKAHPELAADSPKPTGKACPLCGKELLVRQGSKGPFLSCSGFPACKYSSDVNAVASEKVCPKCGKTMEEVDGRYGRYARCVDRVCGGKIDMTAATGESCPLCTSPLKDRGVFLGCSRYPACRFTVDTTAWAAAKKAGRVCPECQHLMVEKKSTKGLFLGCSRYPECRHVESAKDSGKGAGRSARGAAGRRRA